MCLIGIVYQSHPQYELVLAANRDEFHARPSAAAAYWKDAPAVYGGRDLSHGGGWLAMSRRRRLAAVTNVRRMVPPDASAPSRGALVADFVRGGASAQDFAQALREVEPPYAGFNLLLWEGKALLYVTNQPHFRIQGIVPGVHGVSNATLDTPWPKVRRLTQGLERWRSQPEIHDPAPLFDLLADEQIAADDELPATGVARDMERFLSPAFIRGDGYGTRASTVLRIDEREAEFSERRFGPAGVALGESRERIPLAPV
jgi:uncharacterized protein with NRDE domain